MPKPGPVPKGEFAGKSKVLSTRIQPDTRTALEVASKRSGRSLSQEIESRLRRTFRDDENAENLFGSVRNRRLLQLVGLAMQNAVNLERPDVEWLDDPLAFEIAVRSINSLLNAIRPPGPVPPLSIFDEGRSMSQAAYLWAEIQAADSTLPIKVSERQHLANLIKTELGQVASRPEIATGTADELRHHAGAAKQEDEK